MIWLLFIGLFFFPWIFRHEYMILCPPFWPCALKTIIFGLWLVTFFSTARKKLSDEDTKGA